ncbi:MAG TPA: alpha/beta hydrolase [Actinomycetota bacterium]
MATLQHLDDVDLAYEVEGAGTPLVLLHGSWTDRRSWDLVTDRLARDFTVVRYDRRGHSESPPATGSFDDARDLSALIDDLDLGPVHVAASSSGGVIALRLAAHRPELLRSIVSHEPPLTSLIPEGDGARPIVDDAVAQEQTVGAQIEAGDHAGAARRFVEELALGPGAWDMLPEALRSTMVRNAATFAEEVRDPSSRWVDLDSLRGFQRPVLLTEGGVGPGWYGAAIDRLAEALPAVSRHCYSEAGHMPHASHPEEYVEVVGGFLRMVDASAAALSRAAPRRPSLGRRSP